MSYSALILYSSITGNTDQVAQTFRKALEKYNFKVTMARIGKHDFIAEPTYFDDYDLVCLGSPILAALPHQQLINALGLYAKPGQPQFTRPPQGFSQDKTMMENQESMDIDPAEIFAKKEIPNKKGVIFTTYGGYIYGPPEATATLELERCYLETKGCKVIGEFSCPGREVFHNAVDTVAMVLNIGVNESSQLLQDYKDNPRDPQFDGLTEKQREIMDRCANDKRHWPFETMRHVDALGDIPGSVFWHYDLMNRPSQRDLTKAQIFMEEIIEDYFMTISGKSRPPFAVYKCLS